MLLEKWEVRKLTMKGVSIPNGLWVWQLAINSWADTFSKHLLLFVDISEWAGIKATSRQTTHSLAVSHVCMKYVSVNCCFSLVSLPVGVEVSRLSSRCSWWSSLPLLETSTQLKMDSQIRCIKDQDEAVWSRVGCYERYLSADCKHKG